MTLFTCKTQRKSKFKRVRRFWRYHIVNLRRRIVREKFEIPKCLKGNVKDANGNTVNILGKIAVLMIVNSSLIREKILVFKKTTAILHDLLIGMNTLRFTSSVFSREKSVLIMR